MTYQGSLARRVLIGSILLLGLPLLVHTFFLYHREYRENINDAFTILRTIAESRTLYLEQMIQCQQDMLSGLLDNLPENPEERSAFMQKEAKEYHIDQFLVLEDPKDERMKEETFVFVDRTKRELVVGTKLTPRSVFLITTPTDELLKRMQHESTYSVGLSLIDENKIIFLTTEKSLQDERYAQSDSQLSWTPEKDFKNSWFLETKDETFLAVAIPIKGTKYFFMADVAEKSIADIQIKDYVARIVVFLIFSCLVGGGILLWLTRRISRPFNALCTVMQRVSEGAVHMRYPPDRMGFEINRLGIQFNEMLDALLNTQQEVEKERIVRERLAQELKIGHQIQKSILPTDFSQIPSLEVVPGYHSALEVSGDFYDLFFLNDEKVLIAIADAAGKGISACLFSLSFRSMLRSAAATQNDLSSVVRIANDLLLCDTVLSSFFITAWIGLYDLKTGELSYCSQGHPPTMLLREGEIQFLSTQGMSLGVEALDPVVKKVVLKPYDLLLLYTDGITEAQDREKRFFGMERLEKFLKDCRKNSLQTSADRLLEEIGIFCNGASQSDDVTFVLLRIAGKEGFLQRK